MYVCIHIIDIIIANNTKVTITTFVEINVYEIFDLLGENLLWNVIVGDNIYIITCTSEGNKWGRRKHFFNLFVCI